MHNEDEPLRSNVTPILVAAQCYSAIAEICHLKSEILPNFAKKIAKFSHKNRKICYILPKKN